MACNRKKFFIIILLAAIPLILWTAVLNSRKVAGKTDGATKTVRINNKSIRAEIANNVFAQYRGLSNRDYLCPDCGMLFNYSDSRERGFVMRNMKFPLDIIFIDNGEIKRIYADLPPAGSNSQKIYQSGGGATQVLELNAGYCEEQGVNIGDKIYLE